MGSLKISVLVPVYNVETYLSRCIESVLAQDFDDYELILVDDGSWDRCPQICDEYAIKDSRIKIVHKKNRGLVSARLVGFELANGKYLVFLDSDDYLLPGALSILYSKIEEGYDIVKARPLRVTSTNEQWVEHYEFEKGEIKNRDIYIECLIRDRIAPYLHCGIYKASLFNSEVFETMIQYGISVGEDWITNYCISLNVQKVLYISESVYVYYLNEESMINSRVKSWKYVERIQKVTDCIRQQLPENLIELGQKISIINYLKNLFIPELAFDFKRFSYIQANFQDALEVVGEHRISKKYYFLINHRILFFIYTRLFCFTYFILKQRCKRRKVLN